MITFLYLIGLITYVTSASISFIEPLKRSAWFYPIGLILALIANIIWLHIARTTLDKELVYIRGLVWDAMIVGAYVAIPVIFFGVRLSGVALLGVTLIITGLVLTKLG